MRIIGILVTYRRPLELAATVAALQQQSRPLDQLIVVDNDPDRSASTAAPLAAYLATGSNLGPAGGLAAGVAAALVDARDDDWIMFLDDDDPPASTSAVADLASLAASAPRDVAAVGLVGGRYSVRSGQTVRVPDADLRGLVDVDWIGGNHLPTYSVKALRNVALDPSLFFGFDDLDLGLRLSRAGWRLVVDGDAWAALRARYDRMGLDRQAVRGATRPPAWRQYYAARNMILIGRRSGARTAVAATAGSLLRSARALRADRASGRAALRGTIDGVLGRTGRTVEPGY